MVVSEGCAVCVLLHSCLCHWPVHLWLLREPLSQSTVVYARFSTQRRLNCWRPIKVGYALSQKEFHKKLHAKPKLSLGPMTECGGCGVAGQTYRDRHYALSGLLSPPSRLRFLALKHVYLYYTFYNIIQTCSIDSNLSRGLRNNSDAKKDTLCLLPSTSTSRCFYTKFS